MARAKIGLKSTLLEELQRNTSWAISNAIALKALGPKEETIAEWSRAGQMEEATAFQLEAEGYELEAAVHRVSAASCYGEIQEYGRAITLLRAALSIDLRSSYRSDVETQLNAYLKKVRSLKPRKAKAAATA